MNFSDEDLQGVAVIDILALTQLAEIGVERNQRVCGTQVQRVVNPPVHLSNRGDEYI